MKKLVLYCLILLFLQTLFGDQQQAATETENNKDKAATEKIDKDQERCNEARNDPENGWKTYKAEFPNGICAKEAENFFDQRACDVAKSKDTFEAYDEYLKKHPDGSCANADITQRRDLMKIVKGMLEQNMKRDDLLKAIQRILEETKPKRYWSERSKNKMNFDDAKKYCMNLNQDEKDIWRLPSIDELRTVIRNCETKKDGQCRISERIEHFSSKDKDHKNCACKIEKNNGGKYSILTKHDTSKIDGYGITLWSSTTLSDNEYSAWGVNFSDAAIDIYFKNTEHYVRCIR